MANGTWSIDPTTGVTTSTTTNGELKLVFDERTTATQVYTVKYTEGDYCGQVTVTQEGGEQPAGDCVSGTWDDKTSLATVFTNAFNCTIDNGNKWKACPNDDTCTNKVIIKLINNSGKIIPYNGHFSVTLPPASPGGENKKIYVNYRDYNSTEDGGKHWYYGKSDGEGQESNFLLGKNATPSFTCSAEDSFDFDNIQEAIVYFSCLESSKNDYKQHNNGDAFNTTKNAAVSYNADKATNTITITFGNSDDNIYYDRFGFNSGDKYKIYDHTSSDHRTIVPGNIYDIVNTIN